MWTDLFIIHKKTLKTKDKDGAIYNQIIQKCHIYDFINFILIVYFVLKLHEYITFIMFLMNQNYWINIEFEYLLKFSRKIAHHCEFFNLKIYLFILNEYSSNV